MNRFVYGIRNSEFWNNGSPSRGITELGRLYAGWIRDMASQEDFPAPRNSHGSKDVLLGGWSLGGLLSLQVAKELADDASVRAVGILMIDSAYPGLLDSYVSAMAPDPAGEARMRGQIASEIHIAETHKLVTNWTLPAWDGELEGKRPRAILLRAKDKTPNLGIMDIYRKDQSLGWDAYSSKMFEEVIDIAGHHFDIFSSERILATSKAMRRALDGLDCNI
ncbi:hypothetical protein XA68_15485 [Ophiocordyceps unilateralis]|uniref:Thioesterase domain-containing protein n=1 Tax=Ophiocordyceps unilateralis TaxID=268505 RepID=A0A2A9P7E5_OPHUN|nr:hypothetical protein XA68_15485 [Ophiocordyceps unilateralis]